MAELKMYLSEELDKRFRRLAMIVFGYGKGSLSEAAAEALTKWCEVHEAQGVEGIALGDTPANPNSDPVARAEERPVVTSSKSDSSSPDASIQGSQYFPTAKEK